MKELIGINKYDHIVREVGNTTPLFIGLASECIEYINNKPKDGIVYEVCGDPVAVSAALEEYIESWAESE